MKTGNLKRIMYVHTVTQVFLCRKMIKSHFHFPNGTQAQYPSLNHLKYTHMQLTL